MAWIWYNWWYAEINTPPAFRWGCMTPISIAHNQRMERLMSFNDTGTGIIMDLELQIEQYLHAHLNVASNAAILRPGEDANAGINEIRAGFGKPLLEPSIDSVWRVVVTTGNYLIATPPEPTTPPTLQEPTIEQIPYQRIITPIVWRSEDVKVEPDSLSAILAILSELGVPTRS